MAFRRMTASTLAFLVFKFTVELLHVFFKIDKLFLNSVGLVYNLNTGYGYWWKGELYDCELYVVFHSLSCCHTVIHTIPRGHTVTQPTIWPYRYTSYQVTILLYTLPRDRTVTHPTTWPYSYTPYHVTILLHTLPRDHTVIHPTTWPYCYTP